VFSCSPHAPVHTPVTSESPLQAVGPLFRMHRRNDPGQLPGAARPASLTRSALAGCRDTPRASVPRSRYNVVRFPTMPGMVHICTSCAAAPGTATGMRDRSFLPFYPGVPLPRFPCRCRCAAFYGVVIIFLKDN
jgi:hypothetical protein